MNEEEIRTVALDVFRRLETAWNNADGDAFAEPFTNDCDFVDITGAHHKSKRACAEGHKAIFATIYKGSIIKMELLAARALASEVLLAHGRTAMDAPTGPLAGKGHSTPSLVLVKENGACKIASFHNTLVMQRGAMR